jgi:leukocyte cell-derived chemotaxin-2
MQRFHDVTSTGARQRDKWGFGSFGAGRGGRPHQGVDFAVRAGDDVLSPVDGLILRPAAPYKDDPRFDGVVIEGSGPWTGVEVKIFYVAGERSGSIKAGERIGRAQNVASKYPGITNHVHLEVRVGGRLLTPDAAYHQCF